MLGKINHALDRSMPLITPGSILLGVLLSDRLHSYTVIVPFVFAFMTFASSLGFGFRKFFQVFQHPVPLAVVLIVLHVVMPLVAWSLGKLFFPGDPLTVTGFVLAMSIPTGISSMIWVSVYKGNFPVTLSLILLDTFLSPFLVPSTLSVLVGSEVGMDAWGLMRGLLFMVVLPSMAGMLLYDVTKGKAKSLGPALSPVGKIGTVFVCAVNGAVVAPYLRDFDWTMAGILGLTLFIALFGYLFGWFFSRIRRYPKDLAFSLVFNSGMRNTVAGVALALAYFPVQVSIPVITCTIFQQTLASQFGYLVDKFYDATPRGGRKAPAAPSGTASV